MIGNDSQNSNPHDVAADAEDNGGGLRQLIDAIVCLAIAVILFRAFQVEGYMISTGSMAPALLGYHKRVVCPSCRFPFAVGHVTEDRPVKKTADGQQITRQLYSAPAVCPNCGQGPINIAAVPRSQGDQLLVHKHAFLVAPPRRWEVAVFRNPYKPAQAYVKRVIGLPGESIQVIGGDIYANGSVCRKSLPVQRSMRIPVFDDTFRPPTEEGWHERWTADPGKHAWLSASNGFRVIGNGNDATGADIQEPAWVQYRHWVRGYDRRQPPKLSTITDDYGYNRGEGAASAHTVRDIMLSAMVDIGRGSGEFIMQMTDGDATYSCVIDPVQQEIRLLTDRPGGVVRRAPLTRDSSSENSAFHLEMSLFDRQVLIAIDGRLPFEAWPMPVTQGASSPPTSPIRFGARGLDVTVGNIKIYRDVFYTRGKGVNGVEEPYQLNDKQYFVLGDNSPVSLDSRSWADGALASRLFIGKPFLVHLPSKPGKVRVGNREAIFRIPDFSRIRYIR